MELELEEMGNWKQTTIEIPKNDAPIIDRMICEAFEKFKKIEQEYYEDCQRRRNKNETMTFYDYIGICVDFNPNSKIAYISEEQPNWNPNNHRIEQGILLIGDWEIHYDFSIQSGCISVLKGKFDKFIGELKMKVLELKRIEALRNYLKSSGGWNLYEFQKSKKLDRVYKFICYRIRNSKATFMTGLVKFEEIKPIIFQFMHLEDVNFFEL